VAAIACSDDGGTLTPGESGAGTAGAAGSGVAGKAAAGSTATAGSAPTAGTSGTTMGGNVATAGTAPTGGTSSGTGGVFGGGGKPHGGDSNGGAGGAGESGGGNGGAGPEAPGGAGAGGQPDDVTGGAGGEGGQPNTCPAATYGDVAPTASLATYDSSESLMVLNLHLQDGIPRDEIEISMYDGLGTFSDGIAEGSYEIKGDDLDFKYCTLCVILYDQVTQFGGNRGWYMATGGTLTLTSVAGNLTGTLSNATFRHVYEDNGGHSVPWEDGCTSAVSKIDFDTEITEL